MSDEKDGVEHIVELADTELGKVSGGATDEEIARQEYLQLPKMENDTCPLCGRKTSDLLFSEYHKHGAWTDFGYVAMCERSGGENDCYRV